MTFPADIQILYDIVKAAEEHEGIKALPFRALFAAYDQVLEKRGIDTAHDRIYLRFLFRLGELRRPGQPLHEAFEDFLARLGIVLEFNDDDEDEIGTIKTTSSTARDEETAEASAARRTRRASFSSFISYEEETARERSRPESRSSFQDDSTGLQTRRTSKERPATADIDKLVQVRRRALLNKENIKQSVTQWREPNLLSVQPQKSIPMTRPQYSHHLSEQGQEGRRMPHSTHNVRFQPDPISPNELVEAASSMLQSSRSTSFPEESDPTVTLDIDNHPNSRQLTRDADTFDYFRQRELARHVIRKWRVFALERRRRREKLFHLAVAFDKRSLLSYVFKLWQSLPSDRKQARETERFFGRLERRAVRARSLYTLNKAFTHWAQCAADEQARTSVAQRHIIRLRYFNAWKEVTAVNELKVRRFCIAKFFAMWKEKFVATMVFEDKAVQVYEGNLVEKTYWTWFWAFCEERAPEYHAFQLKRQALSRWVGATRQVMQRIRQAGIYRDEEIVRRPLREWALKTSDIKQKNSDADQFLRRQVVTNALPAWQRQLRHAPIARQINTMVERRIVSNALKQMSKHLKLKHQAETVDRWRIMHTSWAAWNDKLRIRTLRRQIDDRVIVQALYRWVLAERGELLKRLNEERLKEKHLNKLHASVQAIAARIQTSFDAVMSFRDNQAKRVMLAKWRSRFHKRKQQSQQALEFHTPRIWRKSMELWHMEYEHQLRMEKWSTEAAFFFRSTRTIRVWRTATTESKKQKLRNAYSQVRRMVKMNLARRVLHQWRFVTTRVLNLNALATEISNEHSHDTSTNILAHWRSLLAHIQSLEPTAINAHQDTLVKSTIRAWRIRHETLNAQHIQGTVFAASHVERTAYETLRKLQLRTLELQSLSAKATTINSWNQRRHARAFLRAWTDRAIQKRSPSVASPLPLARSGVPARGRRTGNVLGSVSGSSSRTLVPGESQRTTTTIGAGSEREGQWTLPLQPELGTTPVPGAGYLSTPSKRAARARALVGQSFTPATTARTPAGLPPGYTPTSPSRSASKTPALGGTAETSLGDLAAAQADRPRQFETPLVKTLFRWNERAVEGSLTEGRLGHPDRSQEGGLGRSLNTGSARGESLFVRHSRASNKSPERRRLLGTRNGGTISPGVSSSDASGDEGV